MVIGIIYKITALGTDKIYIGSTFDTLENRWKYHKSNHKNDDYKISVDELFRIYGVENCEIVKMYEYDVYDKKCLEAYETKWINIYKNIVVNRKMPIQFLKQEKNRQKHEEYAKNNKEKIQERSRRYYEENKEEINERREEYQKQYKQKNKEKISEKHRLYRQENLDKIRARQTEMFHCECGVSVQKSNKSYHLKSKKHIEYMESKNNEEKDNS
jgi:hypothetical protein